MSLENLALGLAIIIGLGLVIWLIGGIIWQTLLDRRKKAWRCWEKGHKWAHWFYEERTQNRTYHCLGCYFERTFYVGGPECYPEEMWRLHEGEVIVTNAPGWSGRGPRPWIFVLWSPDMTRIDMPDFKKLSKRDLTNDNP